MSKEYRLKLAERLASPPLTNIPAKLRELADRIERGVVETDGILLVFDDYIEEDTAVIAFGDYTAQEAHYSLHRALLRLVGAI